MQQVQELALVLVQALDLHVEDGVGRDVQPVALGPDHRGEVLLVGVLDGHELALETRVVGPLLELAELVEIAHPRRRRGGP